MSFPEDLHAYFAGLDRREGFSGVVLITDGTSTVYENAFGLASRAWSAPNTIDTRFDTASITKLFTVAAVLQLIDTGKLGLDTPVIDYLGLEDTGISRDVTVFHLLTHTSGIGDDADEEAGEEYEDLWQDKPSYGVLQTADLLPQFVGKPANFEPGHGCRYNNAGFVLLGLCVERASGRSYRSYVREHVFAASGMLRSDFFRMDRVAKGVAEGVDPVVGANGNVLYWRRNIYSFPPIGSPDGGAHATARDLDTFMRAARTGALFSASLTAEFLKPQVLHSTTSTGIRRYGLGVEFVSDAQDRLIFIQKDGVNVGASGIVRFYPAADITVVLLSNTAAGVWEPAREVHSMIQLRLKGLG